MIAINKCLFLILVFYFNHREVHGISAISSFNKYKNFFRIFLQIFVAR